MNGVERTSVKLGKVLVVYLISPAKPFCLLSFNNEQKGAGKGQFLWWSFMTAAAAFKVGALTARRYNQGGMRVRSDETFGGDTCQHIFAP